MAEAAPAPAATASGDGGRGLSVVVPVYNERDHVETLLRRVRAALPEAELIAVDDASTDGTSDLLVTLAADAALDLQLLRHPENRGKGAAMRTGYAAATGTFVVVQDADLEYDPAELPALLAPLRAGTADAVYGSRFLDERHRALSPAHVWLNRGLTLLGRWVTGLPMTDMETCYKMLRVDLLRRLELREDRFGFDPEITLGIAIHGGRYSEVPIGYTARTWAQGKKIGLRDLGRCLWVLWWGGWNARPRRMLGLHLIGAAGVGAGALVAWAVWGG